MLNSTSETLLNHSMYGFGFPGPVVEGVWSRVPFVVNIKLFADSLCNPWQPDQSIIPYALGPYSCHYNHVYWMRS